MGRTSQRVTVGRTATNRGFIPPLDIFVQSESIGDAGFYIELQQLSELPQGRLPAVIKSLADQRFDADVGHQGMVMPAEFFQATSPVYFLGLPDFSGDRVPIIFVHGIDGSREYSVDGGTWSGLTVSVRIAQDFYIRSGVWLGVSFDKISVSAPEQEISTWGQPFGSLFAGAEVHLP